MKQLPAVIYSVPLYQDIHLVSEFGTAESFVRNIILPVLDAKAAGIPIPDELLEAVADYLYGMDV